MPALYFQCREKRLRYGDRTLVMGILNVTPDSFSDGGMWNDPIKAVERALEMEADGAHIIDIGGESSRPGAEPVSAEEELRRVLPAVEALQGKTGAALSIDTYKPETARRCLEAGAHIVNDITGLRGPRMLETVAEFGAGAVVMHMRGEPRTMQRSPIYQNAAAETIRFLRRQTDRAVKAGVAPESLMADPGIGFGKRPLTDNVAILRGLRQFKRQLPYPLLTGTSRKSFLGLLLDGAPPLDRLEGEAAAASFAIFNGADAVRTHDTAFIAKMCRVADHLCREGGPYAD